MIFETAFFDESCLVEETKITDRIKNIKKKRGSVESRHHTHKIIKAI